MAEVDITDTDRPSRAVGRAIISNSASYLLTFSVPDEIYSRKQFRYLCFSTKCHISLSEMDYDVQTDRLT